MSTNGLLDWLARLSPERGLHLAADDGKWRFCGYDELARLTAHIAGRLSQAGGRPGDVICFALPTGEDFVASLFATWTIGATVCPIVPPTIFQQEKEYIGHLAGILQKAQPSLVVTADEFEPLVTSAMAEAGLGFPPCALSGPTAEIREPAPAADVALLQFTSGSSGQPRGVEVLTVNLETNIDMIRRWLKPQPDDGVATWLPLYHDMGLIGCLLFPVTEQLDIWLMRPDQFIREPARWLSCLGDGRAVLTAAPPFGYAYAHRRVKPEDIGALDFSRWRVAIIGAEPIDRPTLEAFAQFAGPRGFSLSAFQPAYGLAEATLVVTCVRGANLPTVVYPDWSSVDFGKPVVVTERIRLGDSRAQSRLGGLVGCGPPADGAEVQIVNERGEPLPEECLGEIVVRGPAVARGYRGGDPVGSTSFRGGALRTGDAGFLSGRELFVAGRIGDSLKIRGRSLYVEDLDAKVAKATGLARSRCAVISFGDGPRPGVVLLAEAPPGNWVDSAVDVLRAELGPGPAIQVIAGRRGIIMRGSSGKPRRRLMWHRLRTGQLKGEVVAEDSGTGEGGGT